MEPKYPNLPGKVAPTKPKEHEGIGGEARVKNVTSYPADLNPGNEPTVAKLKQVTKSHKGL